MLIKLEDLLPNPTRDFKVDPMDPKAVTKLLASISEHGFWSGVIARRHPTIRGKFQIAAGHHRVDAARAAGIKEAEITIGDYDDPKMAKLMADENATQRGGQGTAQLGSTAAAIKQIAKLIMKNDLEVLKEHNLATSKKSAEGLRASLLGRGIGERVIQNFLGQHFSVNAIRNTLSPLKASGDYERLIVEAGEEITQEAVRIEEELAAAEEEARRSSKSRQAAAQAAAEAKRKEAQEARRSEQIAQEAARAANRPKTFDLAGVSKYIKNHDHLSKLQGLLEKATLQELVKFEMQEAFAKALVERANYEGSKITWNFLRKNAHDVARELRPDLNQKQKEDSRLEEEDYKASTTSAYFSQAVRSAKAHVLAILDLYKENPKVVRTHFSKTMPDAVLLVKHVLKYGRMEKMDLAFLDEFYALSEEE